MKEIFSNVSKTIKDRTKFWVDIAMLNPDPQEAAKEILAFQKTLETKPVLYHVKL